jgi:serine/threonine protein kinase
MAEDVFGIVGNTIAGTFRVDRVVAEGGFAVVYQAHHIGFSAPVALKCLKIPARLTGERQLVFLRQFRAEAELLFQLSSSIPTVVRPLHVDVLTEGARFIPYMALEWLEGETLSTRTERRARDGLAPQSMKKLVRLLTPVARALERAHNFNGPAGSVSIVHQDVKPDNVFLAQVADEEVVKILDFGVAKAQSCASQAAGHGGNSRDVMSFTAAYAAPEQWDPARYGQTGPWTDVWGLALTVVEATIGRPAIDGDAQELRNIALDHRHRPTPRRLGADVDDEVEAVFSRALAVDPRQRFADAGLFWNSLCSALRLRIEDRRRDERVEGGGVPRQEKIDNVAPRVVRRAVRLRVAASADVMDATVASVDQLESERRLAPARASGRSRKATPLTDPAPNAETEPELHVQAFADGVEPFAELELLEEEHATSGARLRASHRERDAVDDGPSRPAFEIDLRTDRDDGPEPRLRLPPPARVPSLTAPRALRRAPTTSSAARASFAPQGVSRKLLPGVALVGVSIIVGLAGQLAGEMAEPIRPTSIAGALLAGGIGFIIYRLLPRDP